VTRNFSPWAQWQLRLAATELRDPMPIDAAPAALVAWRERCRTRLDALLTPWPDPVPLDLEVLDSVDCGSYRRDNVVFDAEATMSVPAFLLVPHGRVAPGPAVLAQHGHGPGRSEVCGLDDAESRAAIIEHNGDYAHQLARRGYVVLALDLRCFGERADWTPPEKYLCDLNLVHAYADGVSPLSQNLWDLARAIDVLEAHPLVDPGRIGMVGLSYGATCTLFLAAIDERIRACVVSGYFSSWRAAHRVPWNLCGSQVLPGMLGELEHVDLGALVAPRPMLVESGSGDVLFPVEVARPAVAEVRRIYDAFDAPNDALVHDTFDGDHRWNGVLAYDFLDQWLGHPRASAVPR
jgi:dienelactone hydrolase